MRQIFDCRISNSTLDKITEAFVSTRDAFYFEDDDLANACVQQGILVYTRQEFASMYPLFGLKYGSVYHLWTMKLPKEVCVLFVHPWELRSLSPENQRKLLIQQVRYGRGHIYDTNWLTHFDVHLGTTVDIEGKSYGFLTWDDWWALSPDTKNQWVLRWLQEWRKKEAEGVTVDLPRDHGEVPYELIHEYAGTFGPTSSANCFAATVAMAVGAQSPEQARVLINEWLHQGPFFRLLEGQGYTKHSEVHNIDDLKFRPTDVLVWHTGEGFAGHAGYAVTDSVVFQKQGQGWDNPWQILQSSDIWYNEYLKAGGYVEVYRRM